MNCGEMQSKLRNADMEQLPAMTEQRRPNLFDQDFNLRNTNTRPLPQRHALENMGIENEKKRINKGN